jgi:predicted HicB family RNase H-like nuclease
MVKQKKEDLYKVTVRLPAALARAAKIQAVTDLLSLQSLVQVALEAYLKSRKGRS